MLIIMRDRENNLPEGILENVFNILRIEKTDDFRKVKRAFIALALKHHPDKHAEADDTTKRENKEAFQRVSNAYSLVDNPQKLEQYCERLDRNDFSPSHPAATSNRSGAHSNDYNADNEIRIPTTATVDVYIPVSIYRKNRKNYAHSNDQTFISLNPQPG